jgi:glycine oxidase
VIGIVGGGLAGTALAKLCYENGVEFRWIKDEKPAASHISSGIINPVTGRRFVLTWNYELFKDIALDFYGEFIHEVKIEKHFKSHDGDTTVKTIVANNSNYLQQINENWISVFPCYQVNVPDFLDYYSEKFENKTIKEKFSHSALIQSENKLKYNNTEFEQIIFAEGIGVLDNPYFNQLDFRPNRGEVLLIDVPDFKLETIKKLGKFICKFKDKFWIGSSTDIVPVDSPLTTEFIKAELELSVPALIDNRVFSISNHIGAFRSTTHDRRPYIGEHKEMKNLFLFNGFGTKGASLIPYCAQNLLAHILKNESLNPEIDINRIKNR